MIVKIKTKIKMEAWIGVWMTKVRQRWEGCRLHEEESERQNDRRIELTDNLHFGAGT